MVVQVVMVNVQNVLRAKANAVMAVATHAVAAAVSVQSATVNAELSVAQSVVQSAATKPALIRVVQKVEMKVVAMAVAHVTSIAQMVAAHARMSVQTLKAS